MDIWYFGANGLGGIEDLNALDAMLADLVSHLPRLPDWAQGAINVGLLIPGPANTDPMPYLQRIYTAFDDARLWGAVFDYSSIREWNFQARPTTGLGPQSQYLTPPKKSTHRWFGAVWDCSLWRESTTRTIANITVANPCVVTFTGTNPTEASWIRIGGPPGSPDAVGGMTQINNRGFLVYQLNAVAKTFQLKDAVSGVVIDSSTYTPYTSGGTWNVITSPVVFRREGSYGTPLSVSGSLSIGDAAITVVSGGTTIKPGDRFLLCNTTALTSLVGAFTLVDSYGTQAAARAETVIAAGPAVGGVIPLSNTLRDNYDSTATPVLYPILDEPEIVLVNPTIKGPDLVNDTRMFMFGLGRNVRVDGGSFAQIGGNNISVYGSLGGHIKDVTMESTRQPGLPGGGIVLGSDTTGYEVSNNRLFGGSQMIMLTATSTFYGVTRDITIAFNNIYRPFNGISTHNMHECIDLVENNIYGPSDDGMDLRCPKIRVNGGLIQDGQVQALIYRISINGLVVDGLTVRNTLTGPRMEGFSTPWDYDPANITFRNIRIEGAGGTGSIGGFVAVFNNLRGGVRPVLGPFLAENIYISMISGADHAINLGGKWTAPKIDAVVEAVSGQTPTGRSAYLNAGTGSTGDGPISPFLTVTQDPSYSIPLIQNTTGLVTENTAITGVTSTRAVVYTTARTLLPAQAASASSAGEFINSGALAQVEITLPPATGSLPQRYRFEVTNANGWKIIVGTGDTIQIETGTPSVAGGNIKTAILGGAPIGAYVAVRSITSTKWIASVNNPTDWVVT